MDGRLWLVFEHQELLLWTARFSDGVATVSITFKPRPTTLTAAKERSAWSCGVRSMRATFGSGGKTERGRLLVNHDQ